MKRTLLLSTCLLLLFALPQCSESQPAKLAVPKSVSLNVEGMSCAENCAVRVKMVLEEIDGVDQVNVNFDTKTAECTLSRNLSPKALTEALPYPFVGRLIE